MAKGAKGGPLKGPKRGPIKEPKEGPLKGPKGGPVNIQFNTSCFTDVLDQHLPVHLPVPLPVPLEIRVRVCPRGPHLLSHVLTSIVCFIAQPPLDVPSVVNGFATGGSAFLHFQELRKSLPKDVSHAWKNYRKSLPHLFGRIRICKEFSYTFQKNASTYKKVLPITCQI